MLNLMSGAISGNAPSITINRNPSPHSFTIVEVSFTMDSLHMGCYSFFIGTHPLCLFCECCLLQLWIWTGNLQACQKVAECTRHKTKNVAWQKPNWHHFYLTDLQRQENQTSPTRSMTWIFHLISYVGLLRHSSSAIYTLLSSKEQMHSPVKCDINCSSLII